MTYVGVGRRFVAILIDAAVNVPVWAPFAETSSVDGIFSIRWAETDFVFPMLISLAYFIVLEASFGATVGKLLLASGPGERTALASSRRIDDPQPGQGVDAFPYIVPYVVGGVAVIRPETKSESATARGRRW